jgi:hypothetical protein
MRRTIILILGAALFGIFAAVVFASQGSDDPAGSTTAETVTDTVERTTTVEVPRQGVDISGPCDEAEHANDPRCAGQAPPAPQAPAPAPAPAQGGVDISGPCDEAEHANDPRCTGAAVDPDRDDDDRVDNSGPGSVNSGHDDDDGFDDHGGDDDDFDDDHGGNSGPGGGGGDDDNSGHGGGDDD